MMNWGMMFGDVVSFVFIARCPAVSELFLTDSVPKPVVLMSMAFSFFMILLLMMPSTVVLSV
jgi:hypothetical protein